VHCLVWRFLYVYDANDLQAWHRFWFVYSTWHWLIYASGVLARISGMIDCQSAILKDGTLLWQMRCPVDVCLICGIIILVFFYFRVSLLVFSCSLYVCLVGERIGTEPLRFFFLGVWLQSRKNGVASGAVRSEYSWYAEPSRSPNPIRIFTAWLLCLFADDLFGFSEIGGKLTLTNEEVTTLTWLSNETRNGTVLL
jgi:hypothetical protein